VGITHGENAREGKKTFLATQGNELDNREGKRQGEYGPWTGVLGKKQQFLDERHAKAESNFRNASDADKIWCWGDCGQIAGGQRIGERTAEKGGLSTMRLVTRKTWTSESGRIQLQAKTSQTGSAGEWGGGQGERGRIGKVHVGGKQKRQVMAVDGGRRGGQGDMGVDQMEEKHGKVRSRLYGRGFHYTRRSWGAGQSLPAWK